MSPQDQTHILTSIMNRLASVLIAAIFVPSSFGVPLAFGQEATNVSEEVRQLGMGYDDRLIVENLAKTPQVSAPLLIEELRPVKEVRILASDKKPDVEHVLWCIRALRYLTGGKDFCSSTSHRFGSSELERNRKYWLYFKHRTCVSFFAMWPSRGSEYIAPEDAQNGIIREWKDWLAKEAESFEYKPLHDPKPEEWLW